MGQVLLARSNGTLHTQFKADLAYTVCILAGTWRPLLGRLTVVACVSQTLFSTCWHDSLLPMGTQDAPPVNRAANQRAGKRQALCLGIAGRLIIIRSAGRRQCAPSACVQVTAMLPPAPLLAAAQVHKCCQHPRSLSWPTARPTLLADRPAHPLVDRPTHPPGRKPRPPSVRSPRPPSCRPPSFLSYSYLHPLHPTHSLQLARGRGGVTLRRAGRRLQSLD